jgi:hypothetical protein
MVGVKPPEMPVISSQCLWMICAPDMGQDWKRWLVIWELAKALQVIGLGQQQQHPWVSCSSLEELSESLLLKIRLYYKVSRSSSSRHGGSVGVVEVGLHIFGIVSVQVRQAVLFWIKLSSLA